MNSRGISESKLSSTLMLKKSMLGLPSIGCSLSNRNLLSYPAGSMHSQSRSHLQVQTSSAVQAPASLHQMSSRQMPTSARFGRIGSTVLAAWEKFAYASLYSAYQLPLADPVLPEPPAERAARRSATFLFSSACSYARLHCSGAYVVIPNPKSSLQ